MSHHKICLIGDEAWLIGGAIGDQNNELIYKLDLKKMKWTVHKNFSNPLCARDDHSVVAQGNNIYVFGGFLKGQRSNDLVCFDATTGKWSEMEV